ncbi:carbohydrate ABC transporter membrane protein 2, CUT1 family [Paenibacillus sp. UNCCL117]|uniref:carbohydrate ABC transporter permease n=1 Tax=unclassified Paenibacillus TaxID=185978 RepID=UPI000880D3F5|nr:MULTISPECIES: carbohydrate ABC transporter permease [unclassified Paenibacillus]SDD68937.1 carbohydrate ABC transporter membrane protein 2, CUT1 family [Paenibacillus sp. cl123]SFW45037.1 carbohydrate ABC transporter membrane protein 2, CUT1 family [Paenibacillus sp. UNCCL117]
MKQASPWLRHLFLCVCSLAMIYPLFWLAGSAFKSNEDIPKGTLWPSELHWENFSNGWHAIPGFTFTHFYANSLFIALLSVAGTLLSSAVVAYGFARLSFPLKSLWFGVLMLTLMLPTQVTLVPQYILFKSFDWVGTTLPLIVPHFLAVSPFFVFLIVQFIRGIPRDLDEAARIDGCSTPGIAFRVVLPLCKPAFVTTAIFSFIWTWDDFLGQMIYLTDTEKYTVPLALRLFLDSTSEVTWGPMYAMALLSVLPCFFIFLVAQKYFVEGIATSGIKG